MLAMSRGWELDVQRGPDWLLVKVKGPLGAGSGSLPLAEKLWDLLQRHFTYRLCLELDQIELLDSHLIGQLVKLYKRISEHDGVMRLCGLSPYNLQVMESCRLDDRFRSYHDREEAVLGHRRSRQPR